MEFLTRLLSLLGRGERRGALRLGLEMDELLVLDSASVRSRKPVKADLGGG